MFAFKTLTATVASAVILSSLALTPAAFARTNTLAHSLGAPSTTTATTSAAPAKKHVKAKKAAVKHGHKHAVKSGKHAAVKSGKHAAVKSGKHAAVKHHGKSLKASGHKAVKSSKHAAVKSGKKHSIKHHGKKSVKSHKTGASAPVTHNPGNPIAFDPMAPAR